MRPSFQEAALRIVLSVSVCVSVCSSVCQAVEISKLMGRWSMSYATNGTDLMSKEHTSRSKSASEDCLFCALQMNKLHYITKAAQSSEKCIIITILLTFRVNHELPFIGPQCWHTFLGDTRAALQIQDRSTESRPVASLNQPQTQLTRPVATGLGMQRAPGQSFYWG